MEEKKIEMSDEEVAIQLSEIKIDNDSGVKPIIHKNINDNPDSMELSTPAKGGSIKIYGDYSKPEEFKKKITEAIELRKWAQQKIEL
jgi:hypothetical protein